MTIPALPVPMDLAARLVGSPFLLLLDIDGFVAAIRAALSMSPEERRRRMHRMRRQLHNSTIFDWLESILERSAQIMGLWPQPEPA